MNRQSVVVLFVLISLTAVLCPAAKAQWVKDGIVVAEGDTLQKSSVLVKDDDGGVYNIWDDNRIDAPGIYIQRFDALGRPLWPGNGVLLSSGVWDVGPRAISDDAGGVIVVWHDNIGGSIWSLYAQRVDPDGTVLWTTGGVVFGENNVSGGGSNIATDQAGGVIVTWTRDSGPYNDDVFAQRLDNGGNILWTAGGVPVCVQGDDQKYPDICSNGLGGVYVVWMDLRNGTDYDLYCQRIEPNGTLVFSANGVPACATTGHQMLPQVVTGRNNRCLVTFIDDRLIADEYDIYILEITLTGSYGGLGYYGTAVCLAEGDQFDPRLIHDPVWGGAYVVWTDYRTPVGSWYSDIYMQLITATGAALWTENGIEVCTATGEQSDPIIAPDGFGGALLAWFDDRMYGHDIYAQRIAIDSTTYWETDGVPILGEMHSATEYSEQCYIIPDATGGLFATWVDNRNDSDGDIYMQRLWKNGNWGSPEPYLSAVEDVPGDQGGKIRVSWRRSALDYLLGVEATQYSVWRRLPSAGMPMPFTPSPQADVPPPDIEPDSPVLILDGDGWIWEWLATIPIGFFDEYAYTAVSISDSTDLDTGWQYFMVRVHTPDQLEFYTSPVDSGYSVDNLAPSQPSPISGEQNFDPDGLKLTWDDNGDSDLDHYNVYRGTDDDFNPAPATGRFPTASGVLIASPQAAEYFDGEWTWDSEHWYGIAAVDINGNESELSLFGPDGVTGDDPMPLPDATFLAQNFPNPFNPSTTIAFGLKKQRHVSLRIYNASGKLVAALINESRPAGTYAAVWNGKGQNGSSAASGVYFYKLLAGDFEETRKMILLR